MITTGSKFFYGLSAVLFVSAVVYGYATNDPALFDFSSMQAFVEGLTTLVNGNTGPLTLGYEGGVGDVLGYTLLTSGAALSLFLGMCVNVFRDADPGDAARRLGTETAPVAEVPAASYWPVVGAFGAALVVLGLVVNNVFFVAGLIVLGAVAIEWTMQTWSERATGDAATNRELRNRIMLPLEVPVGGALIVALVIVGYSRVFLALSQENAVWAALAIAAIIFAGGAVLASRDAVRKDVIAGLLAVGAAVTIGAGIFAAVQGEREFHHHETEDHGAEGETSDDTSADTGESHDEPEEGATAPVDRVTAEENN